jgi:UDP-N-acetylmuramoyl-L-alanyl-D-glutamate--2,6-diaminopimelate ligase
VAAIKEILDLVMAEEWNGNLDTAFTGVHYDSRKISKGDIFVAVPGFKTDGHKFIPQAVERGACGVVLERDEFAPDEIPWVKVKDARLALSRLAAFLYDYPSSKLRLIGVTGTNGKTTTTFLIEKILCQAEKKAGLIGTIENRINGKKINTHFTTPDALELNHLFSQMVSEGVEAAVMEVSSHALALKRVADCDFDAGVFTNLTQDHMDFHPDVQDYLRSKAILFRQLGRGSKNGHHYAVVNVDSPYAGDIISVTDVPVKTYGIKNQADLCAKNIRVSSLGTFFDVSGMGVECSLKLKLVGRFNVYNALAAFSVGLMENIPLQVIKSALEDTAGVPGRFESIHEGQDFGVIVDYAHTPDGLHNILRTAREITQGRVITVFGCGGDRDRGKRPLMGEAAAVHSDYCIVTSDNPRSEEPLSIIEDILPGVQKITDCFRIIQDRREAISTAIKMARKGDTVVIAGKGHENYQLVGDEVLHFDDREEARNVLRSL